MVRDAGTLLHRGLALAGCGPVGQPVGEAWVVRWRRRRSRNSTPLLECVQHLDRGRLFVDIDVAARRCTGRVIEGAGEQVDLGSGPPFGLQTVVESDPQIARFQFTRHQLQTPSCGLSGNPTAIPEEPVWPNQILREASVSNIIAPSSKSASVRGNSRSRSGEGKCAVFMSPVVTFGRLT
jgi:hypothetical protein